MWQDHSHPTVLEWLVPISKTMHIAQVTASRFLGSLRKGISLMLTWLSPQALLLPRQFVLDTHVWRNIRIVNDYGIGLGLSPRAGLACGLLRDEIASRVVQVE
jgi:hypothetical protein